MIIQHLHLLRMFEYAVRNLQLAHIVKHRLPEEGHKQGRERQEVPPEHLHTSWLQLVL